MKRLLLCLFVLSLVVGTGSAFAASVNFLVNPSFEDGTGSAAPPWSLWEGTGGAVATPAVGGVTPSPRCWFNTGGSRNLAAANNLNLILDTTGTVTYHVKARYYVPALSVGATSAAAMVRFHCINTTPGDPILLDDASPTAVIPVGQWVTKEFDWKNTPGHTFAQYLTFRVYGRTDLGAHTAVAPDVYIDDCELSSTEYCYPHGFVKDSLGNPVFGAAVTVKYGGGVVYTGTTATDGSYTSNVILPYGTYTVEATKVNYTSPAAMSFAVNATTTAAPDYIMTKNPVATVSGQVYQMVGGVKVGVPGVIVATNEANGVMNRSLPTAANGNYTLDVAVGAEQRMSALPTLGFTVLSVPAAFTAANTNPITGKDIELKAISVPQPSALLFATTTDVLPDPGPNAVLATGEWPAYTPSGISLTTIGAPKVVRVAGKKWEQNFQASGRNDGFRFGSMYSAPIDCPGGATIVAVVRPIRSADSGNWRSIVDIFRDNLILGMDNNTGTVFVRRNGADARGPVIPEGQITVLSLVVQPDGTYKVFANGNPTPIMNITAASAYTQMKPNQFGPDTWRQYIDIGRNDNDGWSAYNGNIGDVFVYKTALNDVERAALEADLIAKFGTASFFTITSTGAAGGTITPLGTASVAEGLDKTYTITPSVGYAINDVVVDNVSKGAITTYTFTAVSANHTIAASFKQLPPVSVSGKVVNAAGGAGIAGAKVYFTQAANASVNPIYVATTDSSGNYTTAVTAGSWFACASATGFATSADQTVTVGTVALTGVNVTLTADGRNIPAKDQLLFSAITDTLPASGDTGAWATYHPKGMTLAIKGSPTAETIGTNKWVKNVMQTQNADGTLVLDANGNPTWEQDGYRLARYATAIPVNGVTLVAVVKHRRGPTDTGWTSIIDAFYDKAVIGIKNTTGEIIVRRNGDMYSTGAIIPEGQITIVDLVIQPDGTFDVYANGMSVYSQTATKEMISLEPTHATWGDPDYTHYVNVGRNDPDGWTVFNGNIGDVFFYKTALSASDRKMLEADLATKFGIMRTVSGKVTTSTSAPVAGAEILVKQGTAVINTGILSDTNGNFTVSVPLAAGTYAVQATKPLYYESSASELIVTDAASTYTVLDIKMDQIGQGVTISGIVTNAITNAPAANVKLLIKDPVNGTNYYATTGTNGFYSVEVLDGENYVVDVDPAQTPKATMVTPLADRSKSMDGPWTLPLSIVFQSPVSGKVVTADFSEPSGFVITVKDSAAKTVGTFTTLAAGTYSFSLDPGKSYTFTARKAGFVVMPGPQTVSVAAGNTPYTVGDFTANVGGTLDGILTNAATGKPIANGVVQMGGPTSTSIVTDASGAYHFATTSGCGGVELFGDAYGYHCKNYLVTGTGNIVKNIALTAESETTGVVNGDMETVVAGQPASWTRASATDTETIFSASPVAYNGANSLFYTTQVAFNGVTQVMPITAGYTYTFYFTAKADAEVLYWQPMFEFSNDLPNTDPGYVWDGYVSTDPAHSEWMHTPPYNWLSYVRFGARSNGTKDAYSVRVTPPTGATKGYFLFLMPPSDDYPGGASGTRMPPVGKGCYVDSVVFDRVAVNEPLVTVAPDPSGTPVANLTALKGKAVGTAVKLTGTATVIYAPRVTTGGARTTTFFYIGEKQGLGGLKVVDKTSDNLNVGDSVTNLLGTVKATADGEKYLELSADVTGAAGTAIAALGMNNKAVATDAKAQTNAVRVWGKATYTTGASTFTIDDGYGSPITVNVNGVTVGAINTKNVVVTGVVTKSAGKSVVLLQAIRVL